MSLETSETGASLVFPATHPSFVLFSVACALASAAMMSYGMATILRFAIEFKLISVADDSTRWQWLKIILTYCLSIAFWGSLAAYEIIWYRKCGRVPRRLGYEGDSLFRTWPTLRGEREKRWPLAQIESVQCDPVNSIIPRVQAVDLLIRLRDRRWPLRYRLHGNRMALGEQFAVKLRDALSRQDGVEPIGK